MRFSLSEQQTEMQASVRRFLAERCSIRRVHETFDGTDGFDVDVWRGLCELGVPALMLPSRYGGSNLELLDLALLAECLGEAATPGPFLSHVIASLAIAWAGDDSQRSRWLPRLASGESLATLAWAENDGRWQPEDWTLASSRVLTGEKSFVPYASKADLFVVGLQGGGLGVVERETSNVLVNPLHAVDRTRRMASVEFREAAFVPLAQSTPDSARRLRDAALILLAADAFGGASRCIRMAVDYANTREQFGAPIGQFQGLKYQIVDAAVDVESSRGLYWYAAHAFTHIPEESGRMAALAKAHLTDIYVQAARRMVDVHGGIGYTWEFDAHIYLKRAMFDYAFMGSAAAHRERAIRLANWTSADRLQTGPSS